MSSLLEQYQLEEEDVSKQVTDLHIDKISHSHCKKWKSLPAYLKMERIIASDIDTKPIEEEEKRKNFFFKWQDEKGSKATYKVLIEALLEMKCKEDAESVCKLLIAQAQPISSTIAGIHLNGWQGGERRGGRGRGGEERGGGGREGGEGGGEGRGGGGGRGREGEGERVG